MFQRVSGLVFPFVVNPPGPSSRAEEIGARKVFMFLLLSNSASGRWPAVFERAPPKALRTTELAAPRTDVVSFRVGGIRCHTHTRMLPYMTSSFMFMAFGRFGDGLSHIKLVRSGSPRSSWLNYYHFTAKGQSRSARHRRHRRRQRPSRRARARSA